MNKTAISAFFLYKIAKPLVSICVLLLLFIFTTSSAQAATRTWDGGGSDGTCGGSAGDGNKWSCAANWSLDTTPVSGDTVVFDNTSDKNATIDAGFAGTVTTMNMNAGYDGTVTMARSFTLTTFSIASGSFTAANQTLDINGGFTLSAGSFTASSGTTTLAGALTISGAPTFSANGGTFTFDGTSSVSLSCNSVSFNRVTFAHTSGTKTVSSNCNLPLGASPTVGAGTTASIILNGTLSGSGTVTISGGTASITMNTGAALSGFTGFSVTRLTIAGANVNFTGYSTVSIVGFGGLAMSSGSLTAPSGTMSIGALNFTGGTFSHNGGTVSFSPNALATLNCNSVVFNAVTFASNTGSPTVNSNCTLPLGNNPNTGSSGSSITLNGTLTGSGILSVYSLTLGSTAVLSGFSELTGSYVTVSGATADFSSYTNYHTTQNTTLSSGTLTLPNNADLDFSATISGGTFNAPSGNLYIGGTFTVSGSPTFNHNSGTVIFDSGFGATISCGNIVFNSVILAHTQGTITIGSSCTLPLGNNPTVGNASSNNAGIILYGTLSGTGTLTFSSTVNSANLDLYSTAILSGFTGIVADNISINSNGSFDFSTYTTFHTRSALNMYGTALTLPSSADIDGNFNASGTITAPSGNLYIGGRIVFSTGSTTFNNNGGTLIFDGSTFSFKNSCDNQTFNLVQIIGSAGGWFGSDCALPLGNNPTVSSLSSEGSISGSGLLTVTAGLGITGTATGFSNMNIGEDLNFGGVTPVDLSTVNTITVGGDVLIESGEGLVAPTLLSISGDFNNYGT
ncbi:hypothetical protein KA082_03235, partial [Candidatus Woesebacteria bacterium]|nr:hypothetical protein [Candidatus Woesebacteria bacterium]